jgi:SAM-dependent methyltransferase
MRSFWEDRAQENPVWYVDTSMDYDDPDMEQFLATGSTVVRQALLDAPIRPERRQLAVEIGCGLGRICAALSPYFSEVVGVDISSSMVKQARMLIPDTNVRFELVSGADLQPIADDSADFVTTFTVFQHMPKASLIEAYLNEAARVLCPGGVLAAQWNNLPHPTRWRVRSTWWRLRRRIGGPLALDTRTAPEFTGLRVPMTIMAAMLRQAGLSVRATSGEGTLFAWVWATKS